MEACMPHCSVKSAIYGQLLKKFLLKSVVKKVRYGLRQSGVLAEIYQPGFKARRRSL